VDAHYNLFLRRVHDDISYRAGRDAVFAAGALVRNQFDPAAYPGNQGFIGAGFRTGRILAGPADIGCKFALQTSASLDPNGRILGRERFHDLAGAGEAA